MVSDEQSQEIQDTEDTQVEDSASAGRLLKAGREKQGLSLQQVAEKLFLKAEQIDDLENDRIDETTSVTFTRGYIRNYAKQLGLSQEEVIAEFDRLHATASQPAKLQSFSRRVAKQNHDDRWMMVTYGIVLLLLAGVVVWWYQQTGNEALVEDASSPVTQSDASISEADNDPPVATQRDNSQTLAPEASTPASDVQNEQTRPEQESARQRTDAEGAIDAQAEQAEPLDGQSQLANEDRDDQPGADAAAEEAQTIASAGRAVSTDNEQVDVGRQNGATAPIAMVFQFADDCWVNIEDASGEAIAYGIKQAGRVMEISGVPPVEVTLGAPDNVEITVNGEAVDMSVYPGGRTARFSLPIQD